MVAATTKGSEIISLGPLRVLPAERMAYAGGRMLMLSRREMHLLIELARYADRIVDRDQLSRLAWGRRLGPGDRSVDVYVRKLRVKLEQAAPGWRFIYTHVGFGYRLAPEPIGPQGEARVPRSAVSSSTALPSSPRHQQ